MEGQTYGSLISGLEQLKKRSEEIQKAREAMRNSNLELRLKADEIAHIRILSDAPDIQTGLFHRVARQTPSGKTFTEEIFCPMPDKECQFCLSENSDIRSRRAKIFIWVYLYYILHKKPIQGVETEEVSRAGMRFYKETVNNLRYIRTGEGWGGYISSKFIQLYQKYGTLCDRDYEWIRQGDSMTNTVYDILPEDPTPIPDEVKKVIEKLPPLSKLVKGEPIEFDGQIIGEGQSGGESAKEEEIPLLERLKRERGG